MANSSGMGLKRDDGIPLRMTIAEKRKLKKLADMADLSMNDYVLCKVFDYPFDLLGGKSQKVRKSPKADAPSSPKESVAETPAE